MNTAQTVNLLLKGINVIVTLSPRQKPPRINYLELIDTLPKASDMPIFQGLGKTEVIAIPEAEPVRETVTITPVEPERKVVATSCIACSSSHIATIAGALGEAMRFAREGGILHPEVIRRLDAADQEVTIMERIDLSADAIANSPAKDQELARYFLPKIRELRQNMGTIASVDQLEQTAAEASVLSHEFRLRRMQSDGANLQPILALAESVKNGTMTLEQAREEVKKYLPQENIG